MIFNIVHWDHLIIYCKCLFGDWYGFEIQIIRKLFLSLIILCNPEKDEFCFRIFEEKFLFHVLLPFEYCLQKYKLNFNQEKRACPIAVRLMCIKVSLSIGYMYNSFLTPFLLKTGLNFVCFVISRNVFFYYFGAVC